MDLALYQEAILALARRGRAVGRLADPDASARVDNPLCGDRVTIDFRLRDGRIAAVGHKTQGCLLCLAAAAAIVENAPGLEPAAMRGVKERLAASLRDPAAPAPPWAQLSAFAPVREFRSRHDCVLLPFAAAIEALEVLPVKGNPATSSPITPSA